MQPMVTQLDVLILNEMTAFEKSDRAVLGWRLRLWEESVTKQVAKRNGVVSVC